MHTGMRGREEAAEKQFQQSKELEFKIKVRAHCLLGYWAGKELGLSGSELEGFTKEILDLSVQTAHSIPVFDKILTEFERSHLAYTLHQLEKQLDYCIEDARHELTTCLPCPSSK